MKSQLDLLINKQLSINIWTDVYGFSRSLLALGTFLTLASNNIYVLYKPYAGGTETCVNCLGLARLSIFCLMSLPFAKIVSLIILSLVVIGFRPRITAIFHVWVTTSLMTTAVLVDGGDQVATVLSILILPIALTDNRKWHWTNPVNASYPFKTLGKIQALVAYSSWVMIRLQIALIYFEACVGKLKTVEWVNGTSVYYWFSNPEFGLSKPVLTFLIPALSNPILIVIITWSVLIIEGLIFLGIALPVKQRQYLLLLGILFHFLIFLIHGLPTFFLSMTASLILFLRHPAQIFDFENKFKNVKQRVFNRAQVDV